MKKLLNLLVNRLVKKKDCMKQVILIRDDLKMGRGKLAAQACRASVEAALESDHRVVKDWQDEGMRKVVLKVHNEKELLKYAQIAREFGFVVSLIIDAGLTEIAPRTKTAVGIGPASGKMIDRVTGKLSVLK